MKRRIIGCILMIACILLGLAAPSLAESAPSSAPVIMINGQPAGGEYIMNLSAGSRLQFTSDQPVAWKSSKTYRGTIDGSGLFTAKTTGRLVITAAAKDGSKASCEIRMVRLATGISITGPSELAAGRSGKMKAQVLPANAENRKVTWSSSDGQVVSVNSSGTIRAGKVNGIRTAVITATARDGSGVVAQHTVTVLPAAEKVVVSAEGQPAEEVFLDISSGQPVMQLSAAVYPAGASQKVTWKSSSSRVTVDENGVITGLRTGSATVTATVQDGTGRKAKIRVNVVRMVTGIDIEGPSALLAGKSVSLDETVTPKNATTRSVTWESSDPSAASVNKYGRVTASKKLTGVRTVTITARAKDGSGIAAQHTITITPRIDTMQITVGGQPVRETLVMDLADPTIDLDTLITPADACQDVTWKTNSSSRARVDENGVVTGLKTGKVKITATSEDGGREKATVTISIVRMVKKITIEGNSEIAGGKRATLKAVIEPSNATKRSVEWVSSNPELLSVNKYGTIKAAKVTSRCEVTIYAKAKDGSGVVGSMTLTVVPQASSVTVYRDGERIETLGIDLGGKRTVQLTAAVGPEEASQQVKWSTSSKKRATVDQNGLVTGLKEGKVTITATAADGSGVRAKVTVNVGTMVRNVVVSGARQVTSGGRITLAAGVAPKNATKKGVVWSSSDESIAKVNKRGVVTAGSVSEPVQVMIFAEAEDGGGAKAEYAVTVLPKVKSISITRTDASMAGTLILSKGGAAAKLSASAYPASASQQVTWSSSNKRIATVDASGRVTAHSAGRAKITAKAADGSGVKAVLWVGVADTSQLPYYIEVDEANQVVRVYERGADGTYSKLIKRMICSTGKSSTPGLSDGLYSMHGGRMVWMTSVVRSYALYATRIQDSFLFHSVTYPTRHMDDLDAAAYEKLGQPASLGCIRLLAADAKWIHDNVPKNTFVRVLDGVRNVNEYGAVSAPPLRSRNWDPTNPDPANPDYDPTYTSDVK